MDDKLLEALAADGVGTFSMASGLTTGDFGWGSQTFHKMVGALPDGCTPMACCTIQCTSGCAPNGAVRSEPGPRCRGVRRSGSSTHSQP